jgi:hypothetical protein
MKPDIVYMTLLSRQSLIRKKEKEKTSYKETLNIKITIVLVKYHFNQKGFYILQTCRFNASHVNYYVLTCVKFSNCPAMSTYAFLINYALSL